MKTTSHIVWTALSLLAVCHGYAQTWQPANSGLPANKSIQSIRSSGTGTLYISGTSPDLAAGNNGAGNFVFKSTDNGQSWVRQGDIVTALNGYVVAENFGVFGNTVLAGANAADGIFRSANGGTTWAQSSGTGTKAFNGRGFTKLGSFLFAPSPASPSGPGGVFRSSDDGITWVDASSNLPLYFGLNRTIWDVQAYSNKLFAASGTAFNFGVYVSSDNGDSWSLSKDIGQSFDLEVFDGKLFGVGNPGGTASGAYYTPDGGTTWFFGNNPVDGRPGNLRQFATDGNTLFALNDDGIHISRTLGTLIYWAPLPDSPVGLKQIAVQNGFLFASSTNGVYSIDLSQVYAAPVLPIVTNAFTGVKLNAGTSYTASNGAVGNTALTYQWQRQDTNSLVYTNIPGATASTYPFANATVNDSGNYQCVVTSPAGAVTNSGSIQVFGNTPGITDYSYASGGVALGDGFGGLFAGRPKAIARQTDGKLVVGGTFNTLAGASVSSFVRLNVDGSLDGSFIPAFSGDIHALAIQPDGKIVAGGNFMGSIGGVVINGIARVNPDGSIDPTFNTGTGANGSIDAIALLPNGKIVVGGGFVTFNQLSRTNLAWLNPDGSVDPTVAAPIGLAGVRAIVVQGDGKVVVGHGKGVLRQNSDGSLDTSFTATTPTADVEALTLQPDGNIVLGGRFSAPTRALCRLNANGTLDATFNTGNVIINPGEILALGLLPDGRIAYAGSAVGLLTTAGAIDSTPVDPAPGTSYSIVIEPDGRFDVGLDGFVRRYLGVRNTLSIFSQPQNLVVSQGAPAVFNVMATGSGTLTYQWKKNGVDVSGANQSQFTINAAQSSDAANYSVMVSNVATTASILSTPARLIVLSGGPFISAQPLNLTVAYTQPATFSVGAVGQGHLSYQWMKGVSPIAGATNAVYTIPATQFSDSGNYKVAVTDSVGTTTSATGTLNVIVIPGAPDNSFLPTTGVSPILVNQAVWQPDGKVLIGGDFISYNGVARTNIARINTDGSIDTSFDAGANVPVGPTCIATQPDGKILLTLSTAPRVMRLNADGSLDGSFLTTLANGTAAKIAVQNDGKFLLSGTFTNVNGFARTNLARLNPDGTLDTGYVSKGFPNQIMAIAFQADGSALITTPNNISQGSLIRLDTNGVVDPNFIVNFVTSTLNLPAISVTPDGKITVAGSFTAANGISRTNVARLNPDGTVDATFVPQDGTSGGFTGMAVEPNGKVVLAGLFTGTSNVLSRYILRLNADGSRDAVFNSFSGFDNRVNSLNISAEGKVLAGGWFATYNGLSRAGVAVIESDIFDPVIALQPVTQVVTQNTSVNFKVVARGQTALTYQWRKNGTNIANANSATLILPNVISPGDTGTYDCVVTDTAGSATSAPAALFVLGAPIITQAPVSPPAVLGNPFSMSVMATGFAPIAYQWRKDGVNIPTATNPTYSVTSAQNSDSGVYTVVLSNFFGMVTNAGTVVTVISQPGGVNNGFSITTAGQVDAAIIQGDGKVIFASGTLVRRILSNGNNDNTFTNITTTGGARAFAILPDGRFYIGTTTGSLVRRNIDGTADPSFAPPAFNNTIHVILPMPDGSLYVGGDFGAPAVGLARLGPDGTRDLSFTNSIANVNEIVVQPDGKLLLGTANTLGTGGAVRRITATGALDANFDNTTTAGGGIYGLVLLSDNRILAGGSFTTYGGVSRNYTVVLLPNGAVDTSYINPGLASVSSFAVQENGRIVITSGLTVQRLNPDLTLDTTFNAGAGANNTLKLALPDPSGRILAAGYFSSFSGSSVGGLAMLNGDVVNLYFTQYPASTTVNVTSNAVFTAQGVGTSTVNYQWYKNGALINNATSSTYTINNAQPSDEGSYTVQISDLSGAKFSAPASLIVLAAPVIVTQPANVQAFSGLTYSLSVVARGRTNLFYQWQKDGTNFSATNATVATNASLTITNIMTAQAGTYSVVVTNSLGSVTSSGAVVAVDTFSGGPFTGFAPTFTSSGGNGVYTAKLGPDGRVWVGGNFSTVNGVVKTGLVRLNLADGTTDASLLGGGTPNGIVTKIVFQPDGRAIIGGGFSQVAGVARSCLARINVDGTLDSTLAPTNIVNNGFGLGVVPTIQDIALQSDGKIVVVGAFTSVDGLATQCIARFNADGTLDRSFVAIANSVVRTVAIQTDGKIVIGGNFTSAGGSSRTALARLMSTGALDTTFTTSGFSPTYVVLIQPDGKIVAAGQNALRIMPDGTVDSGFSVTGFNAPIFGMDLQADGKLIIGGSFTTGLGTTLNFMARLNPDGTRDASFNTGTGPNLSVNSVQVLGDGSVLIGGLFSSYNGVTRPPVMRLHGYNPNIGILINPLAQVVNLGGNATFSVTATGSSSLGYAWLKNGSPIAGATGSTFTLNNVQNSDAGGYSVVITNLSGMVTSSVAPLKVQSYVNIVTQPQSQIVPQGAPVTFTVGATGATPVSYQWKLNGTNISGATSSVLTISAAGLAAAGGYSVAVSNSYGTATSGTASLTVLRLPAGSLDPSFTITNGANSDINAFDIQSDGKIVIGGLFSTVHGQTRGNVARLNPDGTLDATHNISANGTVFTLAVLPDDSAVLAGQFTTMGGLSRSYLAKLTSSGTVDTNFTASLSNYAVDMAVQPDGKVLVCGPFFNVGGISRTNFARLNSNGTLDTGFSAAGPLNNSSVTKIALDSTGKIYVAGTFTNFAGSTRNRLARLNSDGTLDTAWDPGTGLASTATIGSLLPLSGGQLVVGGEFTSIGGQSYTRIARLNSTGGVDTTFTPGTSANNTINCISLGSGGKLLVGGSFTTYGGQSDGRIARTLATGAIDTSIAFGTGFNNQVLRIRELPDGSYLACGSFAFYSGTSVYRIARITGDAGLAPIIADQPLSQSVTVGSPMVLSVGVTGAAPLIFQWQRNGTNVPSATNSFFALASATTNDSGPYQVVITNASGSITSAVASLTVTLLANFDLWASTNNLPGGANGAGDDPDADGIRNIFEYYFGSNPLTPSRANLPTITTMNVGGQKYPAMIFVRSKSATGVTPLFGTSSVVTFGNELGSVIDSVVDLGDGTERVTVRSSVSLGTSPVQFMRFQLSQP